MKFSNILGNTHQRLRQRSSPTPGGRWQTWRGKLKKTENGDVTDNQRVGGQTLRLSLSLSFLYKK